MQWSRGTVMTTEHKSRAERRSSERAPLKIPVDYSAVDSFFTEFTHNINEGGIFVETDAPAELETVVQLHFGVPGEKEPIQVAGRVAWISDGKGKSPSGMGIEFQELGPEARERINVLVRRLRRDTP